SSSRSTSSASPPVRLTSHSASSWSSCSCSDSVMVAAEVSTTRAQRLLGLRELGRDSVGLGLLLRGLLLEHVGCAACLLRRLARFARLAREPPRLGSQRLHA